MIDDDLYHRVKAKAAMEGRKVTELVEDGLRAVLGLSAAGSVPRRRLSLPIVPAPHGGEPLFAGMTTDEIQERLDELQVGPECQTGGQSRLREPDQAQKRSTS